MKIELRESCEPTSVVLLEADDLTSLSVVEQAGPVGGAGQQIGPLRFESTTHAWIDSEWLRSKWRAAGSPGGDEAFAGMLKYAQSRGWIDAEGRIRAHIEGVDQ